MNWSEAPRRKKIAILTLSVVALAVGLTLIGYTVNGPAQPSADSDISSASVDSGFIGETSELSIKVVNADGTPSEAFVDALYDDGNCQIDAGETSGFTSQTDSNGKVTLTVEADRSYNLRALSISNGTEASLAVAVGDVKAEPCMKVVDGDTADLALTLSSQK